MSTKKNLQTLNQYHLNPRRITERQFSLLGQKLEEFGDLGGIVINLTNNELVGGNQRTKFFQQYGDEAEIEITHQLDQPDHQGTVALGYVLFRGARYAYREVLFDDDTMKRANIAANKVGGEFDFDLLKAMALPVDDLLGNGFEAFQLGIHNPVLALPEVPAYTPPAPAAYGAGPVAPLAPYSGTGDDQHQQHQDGDNNGQLPPPAADAAAAMPAPVAPVTNPDPLVLIELNVPRSVRDSFYQLLNEVKAEAGSDTLADALGVLVRKHRDLQAASVDEEV